MGGPGAGKRPVKIGIAAGLTGRRSGVGVDSRDAVLLAMEEINEAGGILGHPVEPVVEDTVDQEAGMMTSVFLKLIEREGVDGIIAHWGNNSCAEFDIVQEKKIPYISAGAANQVEAVISPDPDAYSYIYMAVPSYKLYGTIFPEYISILENEGKYEPINHKIAMISRAFEYSIFITEGLTKSFTDMGWEISIKEHLPSADVEDWSSVLSKIRSDPPALIISTMTDPASDHLLLKQFLEDPTPSLLYEQASPNDPEFREMAGNDANGIVHVYGIQKIPMDHPYRAKYQEHFGRDPSPYGIISYDQMMMMKIAMENAGDPFNREAVAKALHDIDYKGVMGRFVIDPKTHLPKGGGEFMPFPVYQMWNQENYMLYPFEVAEQEFEYPHWYQRALEKYGK